jgi:putative ABC transport system permease protein
MQRVAIARALVNNPDIILADEPTGALDTETSVQVMEILKEISKERLIIMVTHNPDLAERYSTRIINMLDGVITGDSQPLADSEVELPEPQPKKQRRRERKPSMKFATAFTLSLKNLFTKKGRTVLTSFAGSIGIIGIALIMAVSQGTTAYIDSVQEDTLASYPLTIEATNVDISTLMQTFMGLGESKYEHGDDAVYSQAVLYEMINALNNIESTENDLKSFKQFIEKEIADKEGESSLSSALSGVQYSYALDLMVYTKNVDGQIIRSDTRELLMQLIYENLGMDMSGMMGMMNSSPMSMGSSSMSDMMSPGMTLWTEILADKDGSPISDLVKNQYDLVHGSWPTKYNEIVLVLDENNELDDITLYALGLKSEEEMIDIFSAVKDGHELEAKPQQWSYEEICDMDFRVILSSECYAPDGESGNYIDLRENDASMRLLYDNGITLKVSGIIRHNEDAASSMLNGSIAYTKLLTEHVIEQSKQSAAIKAQAADTDTDILTGLPFRENVGNMTDEQKETEFRKHIEKLDAAGKAQLYLAIKSTPTKEMTDAAIEQAMAGMTAAEMKQMLITAMSSQPGVDAEQLTDYFEKMTDEEITELYTTELVTAQLKAQTAAMAQQMLAGKTPEELVMLLEHELPDISTENCALYYDEVLEFSDSSYDENMRLFGNVDLDSPSAINLFAVSFEDKDVIEEAIADYNESVDELKRITYTDYVGIMMSSVTTIINAITYVLIAFVAISLIVSSIMIGVITLISVQERTKEIGILRAIGASKRNVSSMFNAETMIIGFTSGLLGVGLTYLLCIPINAIIQYFTGIASLSAFLPPEAAVILVVISMLLTLISGIIPSRSAAKKDPVVALRTE